MNLSNLSCGTYTIVYPSGEHRTIRVKMGFKNTVKECKIVGYLSGPNNEGDYTYFGHITSDGGIIFWRSWTTSNQGIRINGIIRALARLASSKEECGKAYALKSGRCWRCNRLLTVPESIKRGIGPECLTKI